MHVLSMIINTCDLNVNCWPAFSGEVDAESEDEDEEDDDCKKSMDEVFAAVCAYWYAET